jgi:hypothetical protein
MWVFHRVRSSASIFNFQYPFVFLRPSTSCLRLLPCLPVTYIPPSVCPSTVCFRRQFLHTMWSILLSFFLLYVVYSSPPRLYLMLYHSSRDRSNWFSTSWSTTFQNFPRICLQSTKLKTLMMMMMVYRIFRITYVIICNKEENCDCDDGWG